MSVQEQEFLKSLLATFRVEADEHLQTIRTGLFELEKATGSDEQRRIIEVVFRSAHSLKGAARSLNFTEIESVCQSLEDVFAAWKRRTSVPASAGLDMLHRVLDDMAKVIAMSEEERRSRGAAPLSAQARALRQLVAPAPLVPMDEPVLPEAAPAEAVQPAAPGVAGNVRISVAKLDAQLLEVEEMLAAKLTTTQRASELSAVVKEFEEWQKEVAKAKPDIRVLRQTLERAASQKNAQTLPSLNQALEFFERNHDYLRSVENKIIALSRSAAQDRLMVGKMVDNLLENSKKLLMLPLSTLGTFFPKLLRDLCRDQGKEADLSIRGDEVEIDRRILEEMKDPLIHILRNCVDHGIETPEKRRRQGKPSRAAIALNVTPLNGNKVTFTISDDGAGIEVEKVKETAVKRGLISHEDASRLNDAEALELIFLSDMSTNPIVTQLSGRGLGLTIVREKTEKLGGEVSVSSRPGKGTVIRIILPSALATFRGILVKTTNRLFVMPTAQVESVARFKPEEIQTVAGRETLKLNDRAVALVRLAEILELPAAELTDPPAASIPILVLGIGDDRIAVAVDEVLDEREVLVKQFGEPLVRVRHISGATALGSGEVVPILNVADLLKSAKRGGNPRNGVKSSAQPAQLQPKPILVVEDSITSRMLLKGILESAGFQVKTAVDGMEGYTMLRAESFSLVVSDVEMPRMNGFDLTARIRADKKLAELPVILVTALESREDREHGIDAGANAYLVKSSLDQSNLLEAIRRLV